MNNNNANGLIGVKLTLNDGKYFIAGTEIPVPVEDGEPVNVFLGSHFGDNIFLSFQTGGEINDGRLYYGHLFAFDSEDYYAPVGKSFMEITQIFVAVKNGLSEKLGFEGQTALFCFSSCD
jgi:hypothetical protein